MALLERDQGDTPIAEDKLRALLRDWKVDAYHRRLAELGRGVVTKEMESREW